MGSSKLRQRLSVVAFWACPAIWVLGVLALCHCPGIWGTAGLVALVPVVVGTTRMQRLVGVLLVTFSVGMAFGEYKAYASQQAAVERVRQLAEEHGGAVTPGSFPATQP